MSHFNCNKIEAFLFLLLLLLQRRKSPSLRRKRKRIGRRSVPPRFPERRSNRNPNDGGELGRRSDRAFKCSESKSLIFKCALLYGRTDCLSFFFSPANRSRRWWSLHGFCRSAEPESPEPGRRRSLLKESRGFGAVNGGSYRTGLRLERS